MANKAVNQALHQLRIQHHTLGEMIGELDTAVQVHNGSDLLNAMDDIFHRYGYDLS